MTTLKIGDKAPGFETKDQYGKTINLEDFKGKKVVLFFYPKASTPGCTAEVWGPKKFMGKEYDGIHRTTFVIDEEGKIEDVITKVKTKDHSAQIL